MVLSCWFSFKDPATTESYTYRHTLSLHDALPIFPLPPKGEGPKQEIAAEAAPTRRCRRASLGVRNVQTRGVNTHRGQPVFSFETPFTCTLPTFSFSGPGLPMKASSEEHTSELQSLMRLSYSVFCLQYTIFYF